MAGEYGHRSSNCQKFSFQLPAELPLIFVCTTPAARTSKHAQDLLVVGKQDLCPQKFVISQDIKCSPKQCSCWAKIQCLLLEWCSARRPQSYNRLWYIQYCSPINWKKKLWVFKYVRARYQKIDLDYYLQSPVSLF